MIDGRGCTGVREEKERFRCKGREGRWEEGRKGGKEVGTEGGREGSKEEGRKLVDSSALLRFEY